MGYLLNDVWKKTEVTKYGTVTNINHWDLDGTQLIKNVWYIQRVLPNGDLFMTGILEIILWLAIGNSIAGVELLSQIRTLLGQLDI